MKIIKINEQHYVIVDDSDIKEGDYGVGFAEGVNDVGRGWFVFFNDGSKLAKLNILCENTYKITHSTQPLEKIVTENAFKNYEYLSLQEVKELIGEVDVEKKACENLKWGFELYKSRKADNLKPPFNDFEIQTWVKGYNQALEDNNDKKYTEEDMRKAFMSGVKWDTYKEYEPEYKMDMEEVFIKTIQSKTQWEVEIVDSKLKPK